MRFLPSCARRRCFFQRTFLRGLCPSPTRPQDPSLSRLKRKRCRMHVCNIRCCWTRRLRFCHLHLCIISGTAAVRRTRAAPARLSVGVPSSVTRCPYFDWRCCCFSRTAPNNLSQINPFVQSFSRYHEVDGIAVVSFVALMRKRQAVCTIQNIHANQPDTMLAFASLFHRILITVKQNPRWTVSDSASAAK